MNIKLDARYNSTYIVVEAENVKITEDISEILYGKKEDGKSNFSKRIGIDITDENMNTFVKLLDDIVYYRNKEFDSSDLIERLFSKLPETRKKELLSELNDYYDFDSDN